MSDGDREPDENPARFGAKASGVGGSQRRWRLDLAYDGTNFAGWATQPGLRTVQGVLQEWITRVLRLTNPAQLVVAGRTDAGVHARGQVAHLDLPADVDASDLAGRLRRVLPEDVVVYSVRPAPGGFDARFAAAWRRYCYRIWDAQSRPDPLRAIGVIRLPVELDAELMSRGGHSLLGLHDFAAFCRARPGASTIRTLLGCQTIRLTDDCATVVTTVVADAFCHSMVRSLVGALTEVGRGRRDLAWLSQVAQASSRVNCVPVLPAGGLTLEEVGYPPDAELASRVAQTRRQRLAARSKPTSGISSPADMGST